MSTLKTGGWPGGIIIIYILFATGLIGIVFYSQTNNIQLVSNNYYEKTLHFENQIQASNNVQALAEKPVIGIDRTKNELVISLPSIFNAQEISGEIGFFRPSDSSMDYKIALKLNSDNKQFVVVKNTLAGKWRIFLKWNDGIKDYFYEQVINI